MIIKVHLKQHKTEYGVSEVKGTHTKKRNHSSEFHSHAEDDFMMIIWGGKPQEKGPILIFPLHLERVPWSYEF